MKKLVFLSALVFALSLSACSKHHAGKHKSMYGGGCQSGCKGGCDDGHKHGGKHGHKHGHKHGEKSGCKSSCGESCSKASKMGENDGVRKICPMCNKPGCTSCGSK